MADRNDQTRYLDEPAGIAAGDNMPRVMPRAMQAQNSTIPREYQRDYARPNAYHSPFTGATKEMGDWSTQSMHSPRAQEVQARREAPVTQSRDYRSLRSDLSDLRTPTWERELQIRNAGVGQDNPFMAAMMQTAARNRFGREDATYAKGIQDAYGSTADHRSKVDALNSADLIKEMESRNALANTGLTATGYARGQDLNYDIADRAERRAGYQSDRNYDIDDRQQRVLEGKYGDARKAIFAQAAERYGPEFAMALFGNPFTGGQGGQGGQGGIPEMKGSYAAEIDATTEEKRRKRAEEVAALTNQDPAQVLIQQNPGTDLAKDLQKDVSLGVLDRITDLYSGEPLKEYPKSVSLVPNQTPTTAGGRIADWISRAWNADGFVPNTVRGAAQLLGMPDRLIRSAISGEWPIDPQKGMFHRGLGFNEEEVQYGDGRRGRLDLSGMTPAQIRILKQSMPQYETPFGQ